MDGQICNLYDWDSIWLLLGLVSVGREDRIIILRTEGGDKTMENEDKIENLKSARSYTQGMRTKAYHKYKKSNELMLVNRRDLEQWRDEYERIDMELAEIDGRLEVLPPTGRGKKKVEPPTLTMDQILDIAKKVGIKIDLNEECDFD